MIIKGKDLKLIVMAVAKPIEFCHSVIIIKKNAVKTQ